jgi:hypothetical protein
MQALPSMSRTTFFRPTSADILRTAIVLAGSLLVVAAIAANLLDLGSDYLLRAGAAFGIAVAVVWLLAIWPAGIESFGAANRVTLLRVAMISLVAATFGEDASAGSYPNGRRPHRPQQGRERSFSRSG